jgi:sugar phosphate isomerase/epimerase
LIEIFLTSRVFSSIEDTLIYAKDNGYQGIEFYLNQMRLNINHHKIENFFNQLEQYPELRFSFHLPTTEIEIGHKNKFYAKTSLNYLMMYIDFLRPWLLKQDYSPIFTMHIGANSIPMDLLDWETCKNNLKELGQYIAQANGCLCLENLKMGWTAEPKRLIDLVEFAGINITFDSGHAASSPLILSKNMSIVEYLNQLRRYIKYVHFYAYETLDEGRHMPPKKWIEVKDIWNAIVSLEEIKGITIELTTIDELEYTFNLLKKCYNIK